MPDIELPTLVVGAAVAAFVIYRIFLKARAALRRRTRHLKGVRAEAEVADVGPLAPPQQTEHPFRLRYMTPSGQEYVRAFTAGFGGIVPVPGWRVGVVFDPDDPENAEIVDNPYLHPVQGAPAPRQESPVRGAVQTVLSALIAVAFLALLLFRDRLGQAENLAFGGMFGAAGILVCFAAAWTWRDQSRLRTDPRYAAATVTHSWEEWVDRSAASTTDHRMVTVYPYTVLFRLPDGRQVHRRAPMATSTTRYAPGQQVEIAYDPSVPTRLAVGGNAGSAKVPLFGLLIGTVFAAAGLFIALYM